MIETQTSFDYAGRVYARPDVSEAEVRYTPDARPVYALLDEMIVEPGDKKDWELLHHLHYKSEGKPVGAHYWKLTLHGETIGVLALGLPRPMLKERFAAMEQIKPGFIPDSRASNTARFQFINANFRVVSRIVLDTMYRGVGASYRFQNLVARMSGMRFVEIQSSMSKYNTFAERAGFRPAKPKRANAYDKGIRFFHETFASNPSDSVALLEEINSLKPVIREGRIREMRKFYYRNSAMEKTGSARNNGMSRVEAMEVEELIRQLQQLVLASPLWSIYQNPDFGRTDMPEMLPLRAFDRQPVTERLEL